MTDTHGHLYDSAFDPDRPDVIERAAGAGVSVIMSPAIDSASHNALFDLCRSYPGMCLPMMGLHPTSVNDNPDFARELELVERYLADPPVERFYGVGEIGLDYYWSRDYEAEQKAVFERQIELSLRYGLPVAVHTREAWGDMVDTLEKYAGTGIKGVMHAFSGSLEDYRRIKACGDFVFGVGGSVTYKNSRWKEILPEFDLRDIVLETDAPWLTPVPYRGRRNESAYLVYVRDASAAILGISAERLEIQTDINARRIFDI